MVGAKKVLKAIASHLVRNLLSVVPFIAFIVLVNSVTVGCLGGPVWLNISLKALTDSFSTMYFSRGPLFGKPKFLCTLAASTGIVPLPGNTKAELAGSYYWTRNFVKSEGNVSARFTKPPNIFSYNKDL